MGDKSFFPYTVCTGIIGTFSIPVLSQDNTSDPPNSKLKNNTSMIYVAFLCGNLLF